MLKKMAALLSLSSIVALSSAVGGCNTVQGFGKDIEKGGEALQRAANRAKD